MDDCTSGKARHVGFLIPYPTLKVFLLDVMPLRYSFSFLLVYILCVCLEFLVCWPDQGCFILSYEINVFYNQSYMFFFISQQDLAFCRKCSQVQAF